MSRDEKGRLHLPVRGSSLDAAYHCGLAATLAKNAPKVQDEYRLTGNAMDAGLEWIVGGSSDAEAHGRYRSYMAELSADEQVRIDEEIDRVCKALQPLDKSKIHPKVQERWAIDENGLYCDYDSPRAISRGRADWCWQEGEITNVLDFKRGFGPFLGPYESLQVGAGGIALMQKRDTPLVRLGIGHVPPDGILRFRFTEPMDMEQLEGTWQRVKLATSRNPELANVGPHCDMCHQRLRCPAYILPGVNPQKRDEALAPMFSDETPTPEAVERLLQAADVLDKLAERGKKYVKAYIAAHGPLRRGNKEYRLCASPGRASISVEALKRTGLYDQALQLGAIKVGTTSFSPRWCNAKIGSSSGPKLAVVEGDAADDDGEGENAA